MHLCCLAIIPLSGHPIPEIISHAKKACIRQLRRQAASRTDYAAEPRQDTVVASLWLKSSNGILLLRYTTSDINIFEILVPAQSILRKEYFRLPANGLHLRSSSSDWKPAISALAYPFRVMKNRAGS